MLEHLPPHVKVVEVGPRDGLQNESESVSTADKVRLIDALGRTGLQQIEITSFVSPKWIPQLADGAEVARLISLPASVATSALVPNLKGYEAAKAAGLKEIAVFMSATESHSKKNINKSIDEAVHTLAEVAKIAHADDLRVRGYLSVVFACPYEGKTDAAAVAHLTNRLFEIGIDELSLGDTIGAATPTGVQKLLKLITSDKDKSRIALHFHDTRGTALANVVAGLDAGITIYDASIGGMGGCPYAPGASGNLATEDLVYMLNDMGVNTGIDLEKLVDCGELAQQIVKRKLPGRYLQACLSSRNQEKATCLSNPAQTVEAAQ
jgi:hydroxymethylglutaryl-CoA lyase